MPTNKTASLKMLQDYAEYLLPRLSKLLRFHMDKAFRGLRFERHQAREKALDRVCWEFTKAAGRKTIVGFGNWSNNDPGGIIKRHRFGPAGALVRLLRRYCIVIYVDEHRTNMLYHRCHKVLFGQRSKIEEDGEMRLRKSYSARYCQHCKEHKEPKGYCVNRDENAARTMLLLLKLKLSKELPPQKLSEKIQSAVIFMRYL
ncbi:hypothetical protein H632_c701p0 [Helicosporidium sp. ATCC 50920]|nr:hypothetical protein H632_c701p0 [Helicosporidium sp. ATCC 50920]|eukprot:KDD75402.1 hypothetical protein H632_c701p0 [Helicosporidium sp. ATCC 50920]